jgi:hypothetical protein
MAASAVGLFQTAHCPCLTLEIPMDEDRKRTLLNASSILANIVLLYGRGTVSERLWRDPGIDKTLYVKPTV